MRQTSEKISRVRRSKLAARHSYDRLSRWYDLMAGSKERKLTDVGLAKLHCRAGEKVLEIGFGTGHSLLAIARAVGRAGEVLGIDISQGMLNIAQARVTEAGLSDRVKLTLGDAARLPYPASSVDAVFLGFTLELFDTPDIPVVLAECRRVLRDGGRICVAAMSKSDKEGFLVKLYECLHRHFECYVDCRPIFVRSAMADAGFSIYDAEMSSMWGLPVEVVAATKS